MKILKKKLFMCQLEINSIGENKNGESSLSKMEKIPAMMEKPLGTGSTL